MHHWIRSLEPVFVMLLVMCAGCQAQKPVKNMQAPSPYKQLSPDTLRMISDYSGHSGPWQADGAEVISLRRQLFEMRGRLIESGQVVRGDHPAARSLDAVIDLKIELPRPVICGEPFDVQVTLQNLTDKPLRLCLWDASIDVLHSTGQVPRLPPVMAASHMLPPPQPRPEDYLTVEPRGQIHKTITRRDLPENLPPGAYQIVAFCTVLTEGPTGATSSQVVQAHFGLSEKARGLSASLVAAKETIGVGEAIAFTATLSAATGHNVTVRPLAGSLIFRDAQTGKETEIPAQAHSLGQIEDDGWPPYFPRRQSYHHLAPGNQMALKLTISPDQREKHSGFLRPGRHYEVRWHYANDTVWFLEKGRVTQFNCWIGHLGTAPVTLKLAADSQ